MTPSTESAALVSLLRSGKRPWTMYAELVEEAGSALAVGPSSGRRPARQARSRRATSAETLSQIARWDQQGIQLLTVLDPGYPDNLRAVHDRPPLIFVAGKLTPRDSRSVAVVGARAASRQGVDAAAAIAGHLVDAGFTVFSGLAAGIDTASHIAALERGGRTVAVIGTGINRVYPPQNETLQQRIAAEGAVVSQFWPDAPPSRRSFPMRNAVMSGMTLATVVVEASHTSGARIQARLALEHGRPVLMLDSLLAHEWAQRFATRPGTYIVRSPSEISTIVERLISPDALVG